MYDQIHSLPSCLRTWSSSGQAGIFVCCYLRTILSFSDYYTYGLHIRSEILCPELMPHTQPGKAPEITIRLLSPVASVAESYENRYYEVRPGTFRMAVAGVAKYVVEDGSRISVEPVTGASPEEVRLFLLGSVMGALLYQRGLFPLHGSAVETPWGAMIFVGAQGIGKSTLAAHFHRKGYRVLSDDVCAVASKPGGLEVLPALAHFRLCTDAYERLGSHQEASFNVDKFVVPLGEGYCSHPVPLKVIHLLADQESGEPEFKLLRGFDRVYHLLENLYRPNYLPGQSTESDLMQMAGQIAQKTVMATITRRRDPELIESLVDFLESSWVENFGQVPGKEKQ